MKHTYQFNSYQVFVVGILTFLQFTVILDFMILSPLGALLMDSLKVTASQFGVLVSAYAFSASLSGLLASGFADRYDRKQFLLIFYTGFIIGTFFCATARSFETLLLARIFTGIFGGVISSIVFAITTDLFPLEARGRVIGFVQTAFSASQILGTPLGLIIANHWGWYMPFAFIVGVSVFVGFFIFFYLKPIDQHLHPSSHRTPDQNPWHHFLATLKNKKYQPAFLAAALLSTGGFMMMPFGSAFSVHNLKIDIHKLPMVYMATGLSTMFFSPFVGRASDAFGKYKIFIIGSLITIIMVVIYTHLGPTPMELVILTNILMFLGITSRIIPSQALMSALPAAENRGAFMSINSSVQQFMGGFSAMLAGAIITETPDGALFHFERVGYVVIGTTLATILLMAKIHQSVKEKLS